MNLWLIEKSNGEKMAEAKSEVIEWVSSRDDLAAYAKSKIESSFYFQIERERDQ
jgi:hypothetical protein